MYSQTQLLHECWGPQFRSSCLYASKLYYLSHFSSPLPSESYGKASLSASMSFSRMVVSPEETKDPKAILDSDDYYIAIGSQG